jgi:protein RecA
MVKQKKEGVDLSLETLLVSIQKEYGNIVMTDKDESIPRLPNFSLGIKRISGGGLAKGRISEIYGGASSGKSTWSLHQIAAVQSSGGKCAIVDTEYALDPTYAANLGVNLKNLVIIQPDYAEQALEVILKLAASNLFDLIVLDSVAALVPKAEVEGEMLDQQMGLQARINSKFLRKITSVLSKTKTHLLCINQMRCLPLDTVVDLNGKLQELRNVKVGDLILDKKVINIHKSGIVSGKELVLDNGHKFRLSDNHLQPVFDNGNIIYKKGSELDLTDWVVQPILKNRDDKLIDELKSLSNNTDKGKIEYTGTNEKCQQLAIKLFHLGLYTTIKEDGSSSKLTLERQSYSRFNTLIGKPHLNMKKEDTHFEKDTIPFYFLETMIKQAKKVGGAYVNGKIKFLFRSNLNNKTNPKRQNAIRIFRLVDKMNEDPRFDILKKYRFLQIKSIKECEFDAIDIEVDRNSTFVANTLLTHNSKIGVFYGPNSTTTGGNSIPYYASQRFELKSAGKIQDKDGRKGNRVRIICTKNKTAPPFQECELDVKFGTGYDFIGELLDISVDKDIVKKGGSWYSFKNENLGQGRDNTITYLEKNENIIKEIQDAIKQRESPEEVIIDETVNEQIV